MKRRPRATEVRPLGHGLQVIDGFRRLDLDRPHQLSTAVGGGQDQIWKDLHLADPDRHGLVLANVRRHFVPALQADLKEPDDAIVLELLSDGPNQNRTQETSGEPGW